MVSRGDICHPSWMYHSLHHWRFCVSRDLSVSVYCEKTPSTALENAKFVLGGLLALFEKVMPPCHVPPRASLFCMYSKWPPALKVWRPRVPVTWSRTLASQSYAGAPGRVS